MNADSNRSRQALAGVLVAGVLFGVASFLYPGGYQWLSHSISALFQPMAVNGTPNPARWMAAVAVIVFCLSMAVVFKEVSRRPMPRGLSKVIEIAGIGAMVYAMLMVTPMHDALVSIALVFFLTAMIAILVALFLEGRIGMMLAGGVCIALPTLNAVMYFGDVMYGFLPVVQKLFVVLWVGWLFVVQLGSRAERRASA